MLPPGQPLIKSAPPDKELPGRLVDKMYPRVGDKDEQATQVANTSFKSTLVYSQFFEYLCVRVFRNGKRHRRLGRCQGALSADDDVQKRSYRLSSLFLDLAQQLFTGIFHG